jgi:putative oxidoreductase
MLTNPSYVRRGLFRCGLVNERNKKRHRVTLLVKFRHMLWVRTILTELHAWQWLGIFVARLAVGLLFFLSGHGKLFVPERRQQMRETLLAAGVAFPDFNTVFVPTVEFVFGLLLALGLTTPLACVMLGCVMIVAIATIGVKNIKTKSPVGWLSKFLYLPEVLYLVILIWLFLSGPGWLSVDHLLLSHAHL